MWTVELYKRDRRMKSGERMVRKVDHTTADRSAVVEVYTNKYPAGQGWRWEIHETYRRQRNLMSGAEFQERYDTPHFCSPASESYWSM